MKEMLIDYLRFAFVDPLKKLNQKLNQNITLNVRWLLMAGFCLVPVYNQLFIGSLEMHPGNALLAACIWFLLGIWAAWDKANESSKEKRKRKPNKWYHIDEDDNLVFQPGIKVKTMPTDTSYRVGGGRKGAR